jgi:hypothetical protein
MKNDPLDWNGDHIHTNFKVKLKNSVMHTNTIHILPDLDGNHQN